MIKKVQYTNDLETSTSTNGGLLYCPKQILGLTIQKDSKLVTCDANKSKKKYVNKHQSLFQTKTA